VLCYKGTRCSGSSGFKGLTQHPRVTTDKFKAFEFEQTDVATADALTVHLTFNGQGTIATTDADQQAIEAFAAGLFLQITEQ
jgi:hypothetical protein